MKIFYFLFLLICNIILLLASITASPSLLDKYSFLFQTLLKPSIMDSIDFDDPQTAVHVVIIEPHRHQHNKEIFVFTETPLITVLCHVPFSNLIPLQFIIFDNRARCSIFNLNRWKLSPSITTRDRIQKVFPIMEGGKLIVNFAPNRSVIIDFKKEDCYFSDKYHFLTSFNATLIMDEAKNSYFIMKPDYDVSETLLAKITVPYVEMEYAMLDYMGEMLLGNVNEGYFVLHRMHNMLDLLIAYNISETSSGWIPFQWSANLSGFISNRVLYLFHPTLKRNHIIICPTNDFINLASLKPNRKRRCLVKSLSTFLLRIRESKSFGYVEHEILTVNSSETQNALKVNTLEIKNF